MQTQIKASLAQIGPALWKHSWRHAELDKAPELDAGDPAELGREYAELRKQPLKHLNVMGGCCGTDHRHIEQIASACLPLFRAAT